MLSSTALGVPRFSITTDRRSCRHVYRRSHLCPTDQDQYNITLRDRVVEGNYLLVVKRISGRWKIVAHVSVPNPREKP